MAKYIVKRVAMGIFSVFIVATLTFFIMNLVPGGPFVAEKSISKAAQQALAEKYGLDKPLGVQYLNYMNSLIHGDMGLSLKQRGRTVNQIIFSKLPVSARTAGLAVLVALCVGIPLGCLSAYNRGKWADNLIIVFATCGIAIPSFISSVVLLYTFGMNLKLLPTVGLNEPAAYIMPVTALAIYPTAYITRLMRSSLLDVMGQDYMRTARAKGVSSVKILFKHALRNAILPVVTYVGPMLAGLMTGSFVVEKIFSIPGLGRDFVSAITNRDYTMIMGTTILLAALVIVANVVVDILYKIIDPRIKLKQGGADKMENLKKNPLSLQLNVEDFAPASNEEKKSLVIMRESVNFWKDGMRRLRKNKIAMVSLVVILLIAFMAYVLPSLWPYSYELQIKGSNNLAPFEYSAAEQKLIDAGEKVFPHILGTDRMGRDFAVRVMMGTRVSLSVGLLASVLVLLIGATYGAISAFAGGWIDNIMMRITDILYTIPDILLIILLAMAIKEPLESLATKPGFGWMQKLGPNMVSIFIIFALLYWVGMARIVRSQVLTLKESEYVTAARALGASGGRIIKKHLLTNCMGTLIVTTTLQIPSSIFTESYLSFLGLGVAAPMPSLGSLATDAVKGMNTYPMLLIAPALMISIMILVFNLFGDGLRDAFDPKLKS